MLAIEIKKLVKEYKDITAVNEIDLSINENELFSLLGVNGAGKSTTIKMLSTLVNPTKGEAFILGKSIVKNKNEVRKLINISPQETAVAKNLSVYENLELIAEIYGMDKINKRVEDILKKFNLFDVKNKKAGKLSGGMQRRLSIACALITEPKVLFLDEPTLGLDVLARRELWHVIESLKSKMTIILTTHYMEEAESLSDRIAIISHGKIKKIGTVSELKKATKSKSLEDAFVKIALEDGDLI